MKRRLRIPKDIVLFIFVILVDQFIKVVVEHHMVPGESIPVFKDVFHLTFVLNPGAAFGILEDQRLFFVWMGGVILAVAAVMYPSLHRMDVWMRYGAAALLGGAAGNLIDRIENGLVVDFLDFRFWPVFNIADIAIVVGVGCMLYSIVFCSEDNNRSNTL